MTFLRNLRRFPWNSGADYSEFESDGTLKFNGKATVSNYINVGIPVLGDAVNTPVDTSIGSTGLVIKGFTGSGVQPQQIFGAINLLYGYKEGSDIIPALDWTPTTAAAGNVKWQLEYVWVNDLGALDISTTISLTEAAGGTAWIEKRNIFPTIDGTGMLIGSSFLFHLFRDPADADDTYGDVAGLIDFGLNYQLDTVGSRGTFTK